jgi:hypothetical protein
MEDSRAADLLLGHSRSRWAGLSFVVEEQTEELERDSLPEPGRSGIARRRIYR